MPRLILAYAALLLCACSRPSNPLKDILPVQVQRTWTLEETRALRAEEAPAVIRAQGLQRALLATYRGGSHIRVRLFEMGSQTSAFEMIQKWRQTDGLAIYKGPYFLVAESSDADQATLSGFVQALQHDLK